MTTPQLYILKDKKKGKKKKNSAPVYFYFPFDLGHKGH